MKRLLPLLLLLSCSSGPPPAARAYHPAHAFPAFVGPLKRAAFAPLPLGSVKPKGWLLEQLKTQAAGLSGHIESVWSDLGSGNAWRGGSGEGWERGPYYLDGLVPLAFLLDDGTLLNRMQVWIDWNLDHQRPDGAIGPDRAKDWWPDMIFLKALLQYEEASGDERVAGFVDRYFKYLARELPAKRLDAWRAHRRYDEMRRGDEDLVGQSDRWQYYRWTEMVLSLLWQYRRQPSPELLALAADLRSQGYAWQAYFKDLPFKTKSRRDQVFLANHGVNNAMGMKANALNWLLDGKAQQAIRQPLDELNHWHGQANGAFAADEQLAGRGPSQGTELCSVVEEMYSLETMLWASGDATLGDALESLAFNALPATLSSDCWTHQYDQQVNQIEVSQLPRAWSNNGPKANLFGLEPEWGCCTANFHQGWPKFAASLWMATADGGLALQSFAPSAVDILLPSGKRFAAEVSGSYPFDGEITIRITAAPAEPVPLQLRIPLWAKAGYLDSDRRRQDLLPGSYMKLSRAWQTGERIQLHLQMPVRVEAWVQAKIVKRGPLLMALDLPARINPLGSELWSDRELFATQPWNFAPLAEAGSELPDLMLTKSPAVSAVFDSEHTPLKLRLNARRVSNWQREDNSAGPLPVQALFEGPETPVEFIPYGAAKLRVAVFPLAK